MYSPATSYGPPGYYYAPPSATSPAAPPSTPPTSQQTMPQSSPTPLLAADHSRPPQSSPVISHTHASRPLGQPTSVVVSGPAIASRSFEQFDNASSKHSSVPLGRCSPGVYRASNIVAVPVPDEDVSSGPMGNDSNSSGDTRHRGSQPSSAKSPPDDAGGSSEFSGLVSYFSSQQDDLES